MATTVRVVFDGEVLQPEQPMDLLPNTTYLITIEGEAPSQAVVMGEETYPLTETMRLATDMGVTDLAARHDRYARGNMAES